MKSMTGAMWCALGTLLSALPGCGAEDAAPEVGRTDAAIIGGGTARLGARPWQVEISRFGSQWCGGSVLTRDWVLTAGHCVDGVAPGDLRLRAGLVDREVPGVTAQTRNAARMLQHPSFSIFDLDNDVALIRLDAPLVFDAYVQPIGIRSGDVPVGTNAIVSGWGRTVAGVALSSRPLREATLPVSDSSACSAAGLSLTASMLCAGFAVGTPGGCFGDSGGPLAAPRAGFSAGWDLIGVVSWGSHSCDSYTVFSRLSRTRDWIYGVIGRPPVLGDASGDGCVDTADYDLINANFGLAVPPGNAAADLNGDGVVNIRDRLVVLQNWGEGCAP